MMIETKIPYGSVSDRVVEYRYQENGKYYVVDNASNIWEINENEYMKLKCPIKKVYRKRGKNNDKN